MRFLKNKILRAKQASEKSNSSSDSPTTTDPQLIIKEEFSSSQHTDIFHNSHHNSFQTLQQLPSQSPISKPKASIASHKQPRSRVNEPNRPLTGNLRATKNIVINYGKAIASFAGSTLYTPYSKKALEQYGITNRDFMEFVNEAKAKIGGIDSFRALLTIQDKESAKRQACKMVFGHAAEIFVKFFSVNWIMNGRVSHKMTYLKYRHRVLRRVKNPELFTYMSDNSRRGF